jgi:peptidoglycan-associated lipoprotein
MRNLAVGAVVLLAAACSHQQRTSETYNSEYTTTEYSQPSSQPGQATYWRCGPCQRGQQPTALLPAPEKQTVAGKQSACPPGFVNKGERQNVAGREQCPIVRVHFAFDSSDLSDDAKATIRRNLDCFKRGGKLVIEGNTDERGAFDYNKALGERRADSVAKFLESEGMSKDDVATISFGETRPLCLGHDEDCWQKNRRATLRPQNLASTPRTVE